MLPIITPQKIEFWMSKLTAHQKRTVKGRMMSELRYGWSTLHERLKDGFPEKDHSKLRSIFSDYLVITKDAA
jgi:hypothetical protein